MSGRACIGSCFNPSDAVVVRAMLTAHGIAAIVTGEQHANALGGLGGSLISLDIWVAATDAEPAAALLREFRAQEHADADPEDDDEPEAMPIEARIDRRKRTGVALLLGTCITFGSAHMYTGAWMRGVALGALQIVGFVQLPQDPVRGATLLAIAIVTDVVGAIRRVRADTAPITLAPARLRDR